MTQASAPPGAPFLATRTGKLTLAFLCVVALLDFTGIAIVNVSLPSIQRDLHFSQQDLQWVISGYVVTYGGFLLLGGRLAGLVPRLGTRPLIVAGAVIAAGGMYWVSRIPVHGSYWSDIFPAMMIMGLGLAILSALATARTHSLLAARHPVPDALVGGYTRALLGATIFVGAVVLIGLRAANTKGEPLGGTPAEITGVDVPGAAVNGVPRSPASAGEETTTFG